MKLRYRIVGWCNHALRRHWGVFDTQDNLWVGNDDGPMSYNHKDIAQIAAQICSDRVTGSDLTRRFVVKRIPSGPWHQKDEIPTKRSTLESLQRIEGER